MNTLFVTGTDTGVGKTHISVALLRRARQLGLRACGFKPVAAGCVTTAQGLRNDDALALLADSAPGLDYADINPVPLPAAIAPHLAARSAGVTIDTMALTRAHARLARAHDLVVVEGAGGWCVPLNDSTGFDDWVAACGFPVVLVVGMRLGCINHALLSADAIRRRTQLAGWVANLLPPLQPNWQDNIDTLRARIDAPLLGVVACDADTDEAAAALSLPGGFSPARAAG